MHLVTAFKIPLVILFGIVLSVCLTAFHLTDMAQILLLIVIVLGSYGMLKETLIAVTKKQFALDYIAILAIIVGVITGEYVVAAILALMISSGSTLEEYGVSQAKKSLTLLVDRIPTDVMLWDKGKPGRKEKLNNVHVGATIFVRKGEVIALDGELLSETGETDESSLTGEPYFIEKTKGDAMRSGTVNIGQPIVIRVSKAEKDSTYKKIVTMVQEAQAEKSPMIRLADRYSTIFTLITFGIAGFAYVYSHFDLGRVLAVLAVATPCPLIIATPIALLGGINASAKRKIIIKNLAALETLSRVKTIVFDKTGTITLGKPQITKIVIKDDRYSTDDVLRIAEAIERNSLHPLAKAIVDKAKEQQVKMLHALRVQEVIGSGISGEVEGKIYMLAKLDSLQGMAIALTCKGKELAVLFFEDQIKEQSRETIQELNTSGLSLQIFTGDKKEAAEKIVAQLTTPITVYAECSPEDKQSKIQELKKQGIITAMVGDGINDAPALALADVGMAFSSQEQTAASEAADIVFLGGSFSMVLDSWKIAVHTISIAKQSIFWGIGLSIVAMVFASVGIITPIFGAGLQEAIDVAVIVNALRASR